MSINELNINNLTGLWKLMGYESADDTGKVFRSRSWPNRLWADWGEEEALLPAIRSLSSSESPMIPIWGSNDEVEQELITTLKDKGFSFSRVQTAMYLDMKNYSLADRVVADIREVKSPASADIWTEVAASAFKSNMDKRVIRNLVGKEGAGLYLSYRDELPVGSAIIYRTGSVAGIHFVGVPYEFKGRGIATEIMKWVLQKCKETECGTLTLQASDAAVNIYKRLGFIEQFKYKSYSNK